jgi:phospholipid transport system substrate-binding protein
MAYVIRIRTLRAPGCLLNQSVNAARLSGVAGLKRLLITLCLLFPFAAQAQTDPDEARAFIAELSASAVEVLRDQSMDLAAREVRLREIVGDSFSVGVIGRFVLADHWDNATEGEREEYLELFSEYMLQTYTRRLGGYSGQTLQVNGATTHRERDAVVDTTILQDGAENIGIKWLVRQTDAGLRVLDVILDGKSLARTQRREFQNILAREEMAGLLQLLRLKVSQYTVES